MKKEYAKVVWCIEDLQDLFDVTEDEAHDFLTNNERNIQDRMIEHGWIVLEMSGRADGLKRSKYRG